MAAKNVRTFDEILKNLPKTTRSAALYELLTTIRKEVEFPTHRYRENIERLCNSGGIKYIIGALHSSRLRVVSTALSVLGNLCLEEIGTTKTLLSSNSLLELHNILKAYPDEDGIHGRVFRILGNICQYNSDVIIQMEPLLMRYIVKFLKSYANNDGESKFSEATIVMGLRVVRQSLNGRTYARVIECYRFMGVLGSLLIKCSIRWTSQKKDARILDGILKFLLNYSKYNNYPGILHMKNTPKGDSLIYLSHILLFDPTRIVKIIMSLMKVTQLKSELPIPEICSSLVALLRESDLSTDFRDEHRDYIRCLCSILDHPSNRNIARCKETVPQLVKVLNDFKNPTEKVVDCCILIVSTLQKCNFHDPLKKEQIGCNIVEILMNKLEWVVGSRTTLIQRHTMLQQQKRKRTFSMRVDFPLTIQHVWKEDPPSMQGDDRNLSGSLYFKRVKIWSGQSSSNEPDLFRPVFKSYIPRFPGLNLSEESSSESDYSPVCSESDVSTDNPDTSKEEEDFEDVQHPSDGEVQNSEGNTIPIGLLFRFLRGILTLLKTYSIIKPCPSELRSESLLLLLLKCSNYFESNNVVSETSIRLLCRIIEHPDHLIPMMQTDIICAIDSLMDTQHDSCCMKCDQIKNTCLRVLKSFSNLAQSGRGEGDIANKIICGDPVIGKQMVVAVPYLISKKEILTSLMINCGGLEILMNSLRDEAFQEKSIQAVCFMAMNNLVMTNPQTESFTLDKKMKLDVYPISDDDCKNIVTFILDDGSHLRADRDFLCGKSKFFNCLLNGGFKESNDEYVKLQCAESLALKSLISLLYSGFDKTDPKDIELEVGTILEVIKLSDRYLLEDLSVFLTESVEKFTMNAYNVSTIYRWSIESRTNILRVEAIVYALVAPMNKSDRLMMFTNLFKLGYSELVVGDIRQLFLRYLTLRGEY